MVGHHDRHGVDVVARQELAEVGVGLAAVILAGLGLLGVVRIDRVLARLAAEEVRAGSGSRSSRVDVADGHDLDVVVTQEGGEVERALVPQPDEPDVDPVARSVSPEDRARHVRPAGS